jgi:hypothetical protein
MATLDNSILEAALQGLLAQREKIEGQIAEVRRFLNGNHTNSSAATTEGTPGKRKKFSAASRRKMAEAQKRRWAEAKGKTETAESAAPIKQKRKMSAAGRKAISDATKKRWAAVRAAKAPQAQPSKKVVAKKKATKVTKKSAGASATAA